MADAYSTLASSGDEWWNAERTALWLGVTLSLLETWIANDLSRPAAKRLFAFHAYNGRSPVWNSAGREALRSALARESGAGGVQIFIATGSTLNLGAEGSACAAGPAKLARAEREPHRDLGPLLLDLLDVQSELSAIGMVRHDGKLDFIEGWHNGIPDHFLAAALIASTLVQRPRSQLYGMQVFQQPLVNVVLDRFGADGAAIATLCDVAEIECPLLASTKKFHNLLSDVIAKCKLERFFVRVSNQEIGWRPAGVDWMQPGEPTIRGGFKRWRAHFKQATLADQAMVATVIWLYRGCRDTTWLTRNALPQPADIVMNALIDEGRLQDWAKLVAYYPGW